MPAGASGREVSAAAAAGVARAGQRRLTGLAVGRAAGLRRVWGRPGAGSGTGLGRRGTSVGRRGWVRLWVRYGLGASAGVPGAFPKGGITLSRGPGGRVRGDADVGSRAPQRKCGV